LCTLLISYYLLHVKTKTSGHNSWLSFFFFYFPNVVSNLPKPMSRCIQIQTKSMPASKPVLKQHMMEQNNRVPRIHEFSSPPSPPFFSCIVALSIAALIFMFFYVFSPIVSAAILLLLCITTLFLCRFTQTFSFHAHTPPKNHRVVKIFNNLFWVVEEKRRGQTQQVKKLLGSIVCFGNQTLLSGEQNSINC